MARNALFPETILDAADSAGAESGPEDDIVEDDQDLEVLLAELGTWNTATKDTGITSSVVGSGSSSLDVLTDELQSWRKQHLETRYDEWSKEKKQEFTVS
jgi:hypothetical protein